MWCGAVGRDRCRTAGKACAVALGTVTAVALFGVGRVVAAGVAAAGEENALVISHLRALLLAPEPPAEEEWAAFEQELDTTMAADSETEAAALGRRAATMAAVAASLETLDLAAQQARFVAELIPDQVPHELSLTVQAEALAVLRLERPGVVRTLPFRRLLLERVSAAAAEPTTDDRVNAIAARVYADFLKQRRAFYADCIDQDRLLLKQARNAFAEAHDMHPPLAALAPEFVEPILFAKLDVAATAAAVDPEAESAPASLVQAKQFWNAYSAGVETMPAATAAYRARLLVLYNNFMAAIFAAPTASPAGAQDIRGLLRTMWYSARRKPVGKPATDAILKTLRRADVVAHLRDRAGLNFLPAASRTDLSRLLARRGILFEDKAAYHLFLSGYAHRYPVLPTPEFVLDDAETSFWRWLDYFEGWQRWLRTTPPAVQEQKASPLEGAQQLRNDGLFLEACSGDETVTPYAARLRRHWHGQRRLAIARLEYRAAQNDVLGLDAGAARQALEILDSLTLRVQSRRPPESRGGTAEE